MFLQFSVELCRYGFYSILVDNGMWAFGTYNSLLSYVNGRLTCVARANRILAYNSLLSYVSSSGGRLWGSRARTYNSLLSYVQYSRRRRTPRLPAPLTILC